MAENNAWWYKPTTQGYDPAAQAQKNDKQTAEAGKQNAAILEHDVANWNDAHAGILNDKNTPDSIVNKDLYNAAEWIGMLMTKQGKDRPAAHNNPMEYISSGQAYQDATWLKSVYKGNNAIVQKLNNVLKVIGYGSMFSSTAANRIREADMNARTTAFGGLGMLNPDENKRTKESLAIEFAANGNDDSLINMTDDEKSLKKAVQSAYLLYNNTGDERYEQAGETARKLLMHAMGADGDIPDPETNAEEFVDAWKKKRDYVTVILQLSQGADAAATTDAYVDVARYKELRDFIAEANKNIKEHAGGNKPGATNSQPDTVNEALGRS